MKAKSKCLTILVDLASHLDAGHNFIYSRTFRMAYEDLNLDYVYISPSAKEAFEGDSLLFSAESWKYLALEDTSLKTLSLEISNLQITNTHMFYHLYFLWGHQIPYNSLEIFKESLIPFRDCIDLSFNYKLPYLLGRLEGPGLIKERNFLNAVEKIHVPFVFYTWDQKANEINHPNISYLKEYIFYESTRNEKRKTISLAPKSISFFGGLTFERGLGDFLVLALFNPFIRFKIVGNGEVNRSFYRSKTYLSRSQTPVYWISSLFKSFFFMLLTRLPNVEYCPNYIFDKHVNLEAAVSNSECIYMSTEKSGIDSGIARMALFFGTPVITKDSEGPLYELLSLEFALGMLGYRNFFLRKKLRSFIGKKYPSLSGDKYVFLNQIARKCTEHR